MGEAIDKTIVVIKVTQTKNPGTISSSLYL